MVNKNYTHIAIVADRSGSMARIAQDMDGGLKTFLEEQDAVEGFLLVDVFRFDSDVEHVSQGVPVSDVDFPIIDPRGTTALNDAMGTAIATLGERFQKMIEDDRPGKVIVLVVTDGHENSSREYSNTQVREMVTRQTDEWKWDFVFLGANIDSFAVGGGYGVPSGSTLNYTADAAGVASVLRSASHYATTSRLQGNADFTNGTISTEERI